MANPFGASILWTAFVVVAGCGDGEPAARGTRGSEGPAAADGAAGTGEDGLRTDPGGYDNSDETPTVTPDVPNPEVERICQLPPDADSVPACNTKAPPDSFDPRVKWRWTGGASMVTPLVGHFTDTNEDGLINLCDTPNVLLTVGYPGGIGATPLSNAGEMVLLAGDTGKKVRQFRPPLSIDTGVVPAFGDIDNDGFPEVVAGNLDGRVIVMDHEGNIEHTGDAGGWVGILGSYCPAVSLYDLEADGDPEILIGTEVFDARGKRKFGVAGAWAEFGKSKKPEFWCPTTTAADLDGDGRLEVITGRETLRADGSLYWSTNSIPGQPHVGDMDGDGSPEVIITNRLGVSVYGADGTRWFGPVQPTQQIDYAHCWGKPGVIHDFDGDEVADFAVGSCIDYVAYSVTRDGLLPKWIAHVGDSSGLATGTAFDFLGRGIAEAIYADEVAMYVFDGKSGDVEMTAQRVSSTLIEFPVVADVDNDSSADILVVSQGDEEDRGLMVLEDRDRRWIPARRIWNQHAYHVTNVREDGAIPKSMGKSWLELNTFRTNAQVENGVTCRPIPTVD